MAGHISWFSWFAQRRGDWTTFEMQTLFKCVLRSYSKPRFGGCGAKGSSESECWDPGPRQRGCLCLVSAACSAVRDRFYAQTPDATAHSQHLAMPTLYLHVHVGSFWFALLLWVLLYSLKHRVLHFIPKVVRFVVRCVFVKRELYFSDQKSKKKYISPLHLVYFVRLTLSYCCSSSWGLLFSKK